MNVCKLTDTRSSLGLLAVIFFYLTLVQAEAQDRWKPARGMTWHIQYTDGLVISDQYEIYNIDLFDTSAETIAQLKSTGKRVICYFSAGTHESWRPDAYDFPWEAVGRRHRRWAGERWLDTNKRELLRPVMENRIKLAKQKGCDAVDPDNVDGYVNRTGWDLTYDDAIQFNKMLAEIAHSHGLAIGLKNCVEQLYELVDFFDFAVNESCFDYNECDGYRVFAKNDKPVYQIQYGNIPSNFCEKSKEIGMSSVIKGVSLDGWVEPCF